MLLLNLQKGFKFKNNIKSLGNIQKHMPIFKNDEIYLSSFSNHHFSRKINFTHHQSASNFLLRKKILILNNFQNRFTYQLCQINNKKNDLVFKNFTTSSILNSDVNSDNTNNGGKINTQLLAKQVNIIN